MEEITSMHDVAVKVIIDIIHVAEYVWKAAHVFRREASPELECWAWTRVRDHFCQTCPLEYGLSSPVSESARAANK